MNLQERIEANIARIEASASNLRNLKCSAEDEGASEAAAEIERAEDALDGALQCLRAARQYAEPVNQG